MSTRKPTVRAARGVSALRPSIEISSSPGSSWRAHQALVHRIAALVLEQSEEAVCAWRDGWEVKIDHQKCFESMVALELSDGSDAEALLGSRVISAAIKKFQKGGAR